MKTIHLPWRLCLLLALLLAWPGCAKNQYASLTLDKIPGAINEAFSKTTGDLKSLADEAAAAAKSHDLVTAFTDLKILAGNQELTPDQRSIAARAMAATMPELRSAAEKGDPAAQAVLQKYFSTR